MRLAEIREVDRARRRLVRVVVHPLDKRIVQFAKFVGHLFSPFDQGRGARLPISLQDSETCFGAEGGRAI
ncbi:hypothetical protein GCM10010208_70480 [Actinomadura livida]|nr:hypothetical protein GCM10010208_70480 [Actinomadura livida]